MIESSRQEFSDRKYCLIVVATKGLPQRNT